MAWEISKNKFNFLDLPIYQEQGTLKTKAHFKPGDRKRYRHMNSCHHKPWLVNKPKRQLIRLRRNCTEKKDYEQQAKALEITFIEKRYKSSFLQQKKCEDGNIEKEMLLKDGKKKEESNQ